MEFLHQETYKGYVFCYHFRNNKDIPTGLRIEPIYRYEDGEIIGFNVSGVYNDKLQEMLNTPIIDKEELSKRIIDFWKDPQKGDICLKN